MNFPKELKYTSEHEWIKIESGQAQVGITDFAQDQLGDIVFVELPAVGTELEVGKTFGVVESTKSVSDLYAPISGKVVEINEALPDKPELINEDPYGNGWMIRIEVSGDLPDSLLDTESYKKLIEQSH